MNERQASLKDLVSQLRQTGQMPSLQGKALSQQHVAAKELGNRTPSAARAGQAKTGWTPTERNRNLPREQGKPGPSLGQAR
jgi:hypothetical protein